VIPDFANAPTLLAISGHNSVAIRAGPDDEKATFCDGGHFGANTLVAIKARVWSEGLVMFKKIAITISVAALAVLAIGLAPAVPTALATVTPTTARYDATLNRPLADQTCANFKVWFLDPTCQHKRVKKSARNLAHTAQASH
jgi:hypothetical protein